MLSNHNETQNRKKADISIMINRMSVHYADNMKTSDLLSAKLLIWQELLLNQEHSIGTANILRTELIIFFLKNFIISSITFTLLHARLYPSTRNFTRDLSLQTLVYTRPIYARPLSALDR